MIRFTCDSCGKDISKKVHCSIRQFYPIDFFKKDVSKKKAAGAMSKHVSGEHGRAGQWADVVHFDVKLLDAFSKAIHANAWDISATKLHCSDCAVRNGGRKKGKVVTMFTKIMGQSHKTSSSANSARL